MAQEITGGSVRTVYVDDSDQDILYRDGWSFSNSFDIVDGYGSPLYRTLHTSIVTTSFSYAYSGTDVEVFLIDKAGSDYTCTLDGRTLIDRRPPADSALNPAATCAGFPDADGYHQLNVTVFGNQSNPVYLDYIQYTPSLNITSGDFAFFPGDPSIKLGPANPNTFALFPGSTLDFNFTGSSLTLRGLFDNEAYGHDPSSAMYTIDGGEPMNFTVTNSATSLTPFLGNAVILQTPQYPLDKHIFHVVFLGTNQTSPLAVSDIIVHNGTSQVDLAPIPPISSPTTTLTEGPTQFVTQAIKADHKNVEARMLMIGLALGGVGIMVSLLISAFFLYRRRSRNKRRIQSLDLLADPNSFTSSPFVPYILAEDDKHAMVEAEHSMTDERPPRFVVHADSGNTILQPSVHTDIADLPPTYDTIMHTSAV